MLTDNLNLKSVYSSEADDLLNDFYIPILKNSVKYKRITGFFSSRSLIAASRGLSSFFASNGKYQLITGAILSDDDLRIFTKDKQALDEYLMNQFKIEDLQSDLEKDHLKVMAWLLSQGRLKIKIALVTDNNKGIFHEKIGIFEDSEGNKISFSGSLNETGSGWLKNIEEFKVFTGWDNSLKSYLESDVEKFEKYWEGDTQSLNITELPIKIKDRIIKEAPENELEIEEILKKINETENKPTKLKPYDYQKEAIDAWIKNDSCGIFAMATGTGKTLTSLFAVKEKMKNRGGIFIVVPTIHLIPQWKKDVKKLFPETPILECHSKNHSWKQQAAKRISDFRFGIIKQFFILITPNSLVGTAMQKLLAENYKDSREWILIADEMHTLGSSQYQKCLSPYFKKRIGLSATPIRKWDEEGTSILEEYFNKTIYEFSLSRAIKEGFLVPYEYHPVFVCLSWDEFEKYGELSEQISRQYHLKGKDEPSNNRYNKLLRDRSDIVKNCEEKMPGLKNLLKKLRKENKKKNILIYCNPGGQLEKAQEISDEESFITHKFTSTEEVKERNELLKNFSLQIYDCLLAMKCLDEGVDVPSTEIAIILASTTNPREYIQRRGRILRKFEGKKKAFVYDFFVLPPEGADNYTEAQNLVKKELERSEDFIGTAMNSVDLITNEFYEIMHKYEVYFGS